MIRKPSLWRAWAPVVYQAAGFALVCVGLSFAPAGLLVAAGGAALWGYGFRHRAPY